MKNDAGNHLSTQKTMDIRCACHRLLAKQEGNVLILKCPRCKRETRIEIATGKVSTQRHQLN